MVPVKDELATKRAEVLTCRLSGPAPDSDLRRCGSGRQRGAGDQPGLGGWASRPAVSLGESHELVRMLTRRLCWQHTPMAAGLAACNWPPDAARLPWVASAYPE